MLLLALLLQAGTDVEIKHPWKGDFKDDYKDPKTKALVMHYRMRVPDKLPEQKHLGLIVAFHGMNGTEDHTTGFAINAAKSAGLADQYVIMGGKSKGAGWATNDDKDLLAWIAWAKETYPIDPRRVHLIGMSNGGWMVKRFGWANQGLFASVTSYCGGGVDFSNPPKDAPPLGKPGTPMAPSETKTEWYFVHGDADKEVPHDASRRACAQLKEKGYRYVYREIAGADHGGITKYGDVAEDVVRFMHALRHKEIPLSAAEKKELATLVSKVKNEKGAAAEPFLKEAQRLGGAPGARVVDAAMGVSDVEVKKAAAATAVDTLYGREIVLELAKLTKDKSVEVRRAAFEGMSTASNWRYEEAQQHLARVARQKSAAAEDRVAAIHGLGKTVKLQLLGNLEDKLPLWTLVLLLDDDDLQVRTSAFAALEKGVKDTFEYKPELEAPARKAPMAKWKSWTQTKVGPLEGVARP
jgi:dienelactone hydrolase/HEAT repeat protein